MFCGHLEAMLYTEICQKGIFFNIEPFMTWFHKFRIQFSVDLKTNLSLNSKSEQNQRARLCVPYLFVKTLWKKSIRKSKYFDTLK